MRVCQAEARRPCRHFLDQKKVAKESAARGLFLVLLRSHRKSGLHFLCREKVTKSGRGAPRAPVQGDSHPAGGVGPACRSIRGRIRASTGPLVGLALPAPLGQGGGRQPSPPLVVAGSGLTFPPWVGCGKWGPKGSLEPAGWPPLARKSFQPSAFRILSPFSALVVYSESGAQPSAIQTLLSRTWQRAPARPGCRAPREACASQNCPRLYQGESGGLEPAMKPMAGQAGAPLHSLSP